MNPESLRELLPLLTEHGVLVTFLVTLVARIGLPVPVSPLLVTAGGLAGAGVASWEGAGALAAGAVAANVLGAELWFLAGRRYGQAIMRLLCRISMSSDSCVQRSHTLVGRWGGLSLIAAQFVPGVTLAAAPMAGALKMMHVRFVAYQTLASLLWVLAFMALGVTFSSQLAQLVDRLDDAGVVAAALAVSGIAAVAALRYWRRVRSSVQTKAISEAGAGATQRLAGIGRHERQTGEAATGRSSPSTSPCACGSN